MDDPVGRLQSQLRDDERLLWQGAPDPLVRFTRVDAILLYLVVSYGTGLAPWFYFSPRISGSFADVAGALPTAGWLYFPVGRLIYRRYSRSRTAYAVTTTRALIVGPQRSREKPLRDEPIKILRRDSQHVALTIGAAAPRQSPFQFESVADPGALLAALAQAGAQPVPSRCHIRCHILCHSRAAFLLDRHEAVNAPVSPPARAAVSPAGSPPGSPGQSSPADRSKPRPFWLAESFVRQSGPRVTLKA